MGQYGDDIAQVATFKQPAAINVGKSAAVLFAIRCTPPPCSLRFLGEDIQ